MKQIDIRLTRDPKYAAALARYTELKTELNALERQRDEIQAGIGALENEASNRINQEAMTLLSGAPGLANPKRDELTKILSEITHRLAVLRSAVSMQKAIVADLRSEVGKAIATDMLPQHQACVVAMVKAVFQLNAAAEAEFDLREALHLNDVPYGSHIRPMQLSGFGLLRDPFSRASAFVIEAYEHGFITLEEVPNKLKESARAKKAKPAPAEPARTRTDSDGWVGAS